LPFRFTISKVTLLNIHGQWRKNIVKAFILSFFHRKCHASAEHNEWGRLNNPKKFILNNTKTVIPICYRVTVEKAGLVACCAVWLADTWRWNITNKLPNHTAQQPRSPASSIRKQVCNK
jgi:hypothetical protein